MSWFKRRSGSGKADSKVKGEGKGRKTEPARPAGRRMPTLDAKPGDGRHDEIKRKVQGEVCAILARTILELIQSSHARIASTDELVRRQAINRLYADVLYDFLASGEAPSFDPSAEVLGWARQAMERWGADRPQLKEGVERDKAALSESILAALEAASHDETLRKAAVERMKAASRAPAAEKPAGG